MCLEKHVFIKKNVYKVAGCRSDYSEVLIYGMWDYEYDPAQDMTM